MYLLGHGYAPILRYTDRYGTDARARSSPFLPNDGMLTSDGVATFPDANLDPTTGTRDEKAQIGFAGVYLPTLPTTVGRARRLPGRARPGLMLSAYQGDLGLDAGAPQSVYTLDQRQIDAERARTGRRAASCSSPARSGPCPTARPSSSSAPGSGSAVSVRHDPGEPIVLVGAAALLVGLLRLADRQAPAGAAAGSPPTRRFGGRTAARGLPGLRRRVRRHCRRGGPCCERARPGGAN